MQGCSIIVGCLTALAVLLGGLDSRAAAQDVAAAAGAFEQGQAAQLRGDHGEAARFFELADRLAPSPAALRSAIRNHAAAQNRARAATLATDALRRYPADADVREVADEALSVIDELGAVVVRCDSPCTILVDEIAIDTAPALERSFFVEPGERRIDARFDEGRTAEQARAIGAGTRLELTLAAPASSESTEAPPSDATDPSEAATGGDEADGRGEAEATDVRASADVDGEAGSAGAAAPESSGVPLWIPLAALGATAVVGALALWSGLDTLSARDAYVEAPTEAGYEDGVGRQARTNALIGVTVGLAAVTALLFVFADMGSDESGVSASVAAGPEGGALVLSGGF